MEIINNSDIRIKSILLKYRKECKGHPNISKFVNVVKYNADTIALYNNLTLGFVILNAQEFKDVTKIQYLTDNWFLVYEDDMLDSAADAVSSLYDNQYLKYYSYDGTVTYTIFTTTDCNARCPYCFEPKANMLHMSEKVAEDLVQFILKHSRNMEIKLRWFGGEPLYNFRAIELITDRLTEENVKFSSTMFTNGYLIDESKISYYVDKMHLTKVQITLDAVGSKYNDIKRYIYKDTDAFSKVINNMHLLIEAGIKVSTRLNVDKTTKDDVLDLIDYLHTEFGHSPKFSVYCSPIFETFTNADEEDRKQSLKDIEEVSDKLRKCGYNRLTTKLKSMVTTNKCMTTSAHSITVLPDGKISKCEHYTTDHFIGSIYSDDIDLNMCKILSERAVNDYDICKDCMKRPTCFRTKCCTGVSTGGVCNNQIKDYALLIQKNAIIKSVSKHLKSKH